MPEAATPSATSASAPICLEIKADLNGNGLKSASQILGTATADAQQQRCAPPWAAAIEIVLLGIHTTDLKADMIHLY